MTARRLGALAVLLYAVSWFAPVIETRGDLLSGSAPGWRAFQFAISPLFGNDLGAHPLRLAWMVSSALTNLLLLVTLWRLFRRAPRLPSSLGRALVGATLVNAGWMLLPGAMRDLRIGYYLWLVAFAVGAAAARLDAHPPTARAGDGGAAA